MQNNIFFKSSYDETDKILSDEIDKSSSDEIEIFTITKDKEKIYSGIFESLNAIIKYQKILS